jgi:hypothetical protein
MTRTESLIYRRRRGTTGAQRPASLLALTCGAAMTRPVLGHVWGAEAVSHWRLPTSDARGEISRLSLSWHDDARLRIVMLIRHRSER